MTQDITDLPAEVREIVERFVAIERTDKQRLEIELRLVKEELRRVLLGKYGPKSEKLSDLQLQLLEAEPCVTVEEIAGESERVATDPAARTPRKPADDGKGKHPGRVELPAHLERRLEIIPVAPAECRCGQCGKDQPIIGYEESEHLELEPLKYFVRQIRREKRGSCGCRGGVVCAPLPVRILPKSKQKKTITRNEVEEIVAKIARIPPANVSNDDRSKLQTIERDLKSVVFGQDLSLIHI